ncbi:glutathione S-transferase family protein [Leptospira levettii]|uniref:glutathione transferase n=1 Tax=Leptospira levettii TaxID=2023178 RepID=A0ABY2MNG3_9LEPT|nr:glutathione S-transferase family protein [Leptospira levettii]TGL70814.1 glutathione S-transferase family protein [Leptospira levettii]TGM28033.1 glutathione S-transferase family protein [Leptospira levettii]TGM78828.1 glutathione S-transferase family protein [Leptospira levettii]TGM82791.1 glutathione S-transferase family protein [Leptospira levettii]
MAKPTLISFKLCPYVQRSVINLLEKKVDYEIKYIDLANKPDWFLKISPFGRVPVLVVGEEVLFESAVINEYLDETNLPTLHPKDPLVKAKHRAWAEFASALLVDQYLWTMSKDEVESNKKRDEILSKFKILEPVLPEPKGGKLFFAGDSMHLVDTAYAPFFMRLDFLKSKVPEFDLVSGFPKIQIWSDTLLSLPSVKNSVLPEVPKEYIEFIKAHNSWLGGKL